MLINIIPAHLVLNLKKAGTTNISYKIGNKTYKTAVTVKNYTNPLKTVTIKGINSGKNVTSKQNKQNTAYLSLKKNVEDSILTLKGNKDWKISSVDVYYYTKDENGFSSKEQLNYYSSSNGRSSLKISLGDLNKKEAFEVHIMMLNSKDGGNIDCHYYINMD